nr:lamin tail domain-containing protein [uncultured Flavobacterium sp.]
MKKNVHKAFSNAMVAAIALTGMTAWSQLSLPAASPYTQDFNTTPGATGTAYPTGWASYNRTTLDDAMTVGTAASTSGANYNYGSKIGILGSSSNFAPSSIVLALGSTAGKSGLTISYNVLKIREQGRSNSFNLEVSTTSATSGFMPVAGGAYESGTIAEGTSVSYTGIDISALDNVSGNVWIRWSYTEISGSGSRDGIALDDVVLSWDTLPTLATPVATPATSVVYNSFVANWLPVTGAEAYRLDVSKSSTFGSTAYAGDLFFSEYVEGSSTNKYLEIYNGTGNTVDLSDYKVRLYANGSTTASGNSFDVQLAGSLPHNSTVVLKNSGAALYSGNTVTVASVNFNGNDAIALYKISTGANVDIFGRIGENPGLAWTAGANTTLDKTLVRKSSVGSGVTVNPASGFPTLGTEWELLDIDNVSNLGTHTFAGVSPSFVPGYEDLAVTDTFKEVSGLEPNTDYYYRVRAIAGINTTANSNIISVTTAVSILPTLTVTEPAGFGEVCINAVSAPVVITVAGTNLTNDDVTVGPLAGFTFSETETGTYADSLAVSQPGGTLSKQIYVRFHPVAGVSYAGNITVGGAGANDVLAAVAGVGVNTAATVAVVSTQNTTSDAEIVSEVTLAGCSDVTERGIVYGLTPSPAIDGPGVNMEVSGDGLGQYTIFFDGLIGGSTYYVRAYAINEGGVSYSAQTSFTTNNVGAPIATAADGETSTSFNANWLTTVGAESYRLDVSESSSFGTAAPATDLFFSEYVEGTSTNKYLEIFNGTGAAVDLSDYRVRLYSNGSTTATGTANDVQLSGTLASGSVVVIKNTGATIYAGATTTVASVNFNGNDAIALYKISADANVDIFGRIGENPGSAWTGAVNSTLDKTLIRKASVSGGVTVNPAEGFPTLETEWDVADVNDVTNLGTHNYAGMTPSFVPGYENLEVIDIMQAVTGLTPGVTYYYRVRAVGGNISDNSNVVEVELPASVTERQALKKTAKVQGTDSLVVYRQNGALAISSNNDIASVTVFDITGKLLFQSGNYNSKEVVINDLAVANQMLVVKVYTVNNQLQVKKIVH